MVFLSILIKIIVIIAAVLLPAVPFVSEYLTFKRDKENKITYKRFRIVVYTLAYVVAVTLLLFLIKELILLVQSLAFVQWAAVKIAFSGRLGYCARVLAAILINFAIGTLFASFCKVVRIGLKKVSLTIPKKKTGEFSFAQKTERRLIKFFHKESWFFVGKILKYSSIALSVIYMLVFAAYLFPAVFGAPFIPYGFISMVFEAGYLYPTITLLAMWQGWFFLEGMKRVEEECPELVFEEQSEAYTVPVDLKAVDDEVKKQFRDYYACDLKTSETLGEEISSAEHHAVTKLIAQAVEHDERNPQKAKETYLNCLDKLVSTEKSVLISGTFFSEFSMYFLRYLSAVVARGDNVVFVCNNDLQIESVYNYIKQGLSELSSLYCKGFHTDAVDFDDPIWRVIKIFGEDDVIDEAFVDDNSILVTSLSYICSTHFESRHSRFVHLLDTVVFVDTLQTVNTYNRQLAMLNTRLKHITKINSLLSKNGNINAEFKIRYMSKPVRYICFDHTRTPGLDKVLKNLLAVEIESADSMRYNPSTIVRCYNYEGTADKNGRRICPQFLNADEEIGALMNMAVLCLAKGASNVTVFADDTIPYANIEETIAANMGKVSIKADGSNIRLNTPLYNPDDYSVIIAMDSGDNLPAALRKYMSMTSDKPALVIIFSRPYMLRDYYLGNIDKLWNTVQYERVPVEEGSKKDVAQRILVKANAGGISEEEILRTVAGVPGLDSLAEKRDVNGILMAALEVYGFSAEEKADLFRYFEYTASRDFDENGAYSSVSKVLLRKQGKLFDMVNGRDMVIMCLGDREVQLPVPKSRLTQNYIAGQNILYQGNIYYIQKLDTAEGRVYARLAVGGKNDEPYRYAQSRHYHIELTSDKIERIFPSKHVVLNRENEGVSVSDAYISVFRAPMEVVTKGYFEIDPHTLSLGVGQKEYHSISDEGDDILAKQTYRRYGMLASPMYSSDAVMKSTHLNADEKGALALSIRLCGVFGKDVNKTMVTAAAMLNELLGTMFPSVKDSVAVCPVLKGFVPDEESAAVLDKQPQISVTRDEEPSASDFEIVIIEDSSADLGVGALLMSAGDDLLNTLFSPIFNYLKWHSETDKKSEYLYYGLEHMPSCFDIESLYKLSGLIGDDKHDLKFVDIESVLEYTVCDFCGKRYAKTESVAQLEDGRKMCADCAANLVGNNKKVLKSHLDRAKRFLESTYGITLDEDYEFCFESAVKIANTLKQNRALITRGGDVPLRSYVDENKKVHAEHSIPSVNLSELLVRELTHVWQLKHLPDIDEALAEGHIALVAIQYLRFLNSRSLANIRTAYYESTSNLSGVGYRKLVSELLANPQFNNNPFRYLLEISGGREEEIIPPAPRVIQTGDYGLSYVPEKQDRALDGNITYFYYSRLTATCQKAYDRALEAIKAHAPSVTVEGCSFNDMRNVSEAISYDHPELFWYNTFSMYGNTVNLLYGASAEEAEVLRRRIDEAVPQYLEGIDDSMSAYDVAIRLHVKVISAVDYDTIALNKQRSEGGPALDKIDYLRTICGVFLDGKAVCEGYARAIQYLLQKCGIEAAETAGFIRNENGEKDGAHAWNIIKIDGDYYYLDTTWDDSSNTIQTVKQTDPGFDYFCITTEELCRTRDVSLCPTAVPTCTAVRANYFTHNNFVIDSYELARIKAIAQAAAENQCAAFTFKCLDAAVYDESLDRMCANDRDCYEVLKAAAKKNKQIRTDAYSYSYDKNIRTITVKFKFK